MKLFPFRKDRNAGQDSAEADRAFEVLQAVRDERRREPAGEGWTKLRSRRRRRGITRALARMAALVVLGLGLYGVVEAGRMGFNFVRTDTELFRVKSIVVTGTERLSGTAVIEAAGLHVGDDILGLDMSELMLRVQGLPRVKSVTARRTFKREVYLVIEERRSHALVLLGDMHEVDEEGVVLPPDSLDGVADLTIIFGLDAPVPEYGHRIQAEGLMPALRLVGNLSRPEVGLDAAVSEIRAGQPDSLVMVMMQDGVPVRVGNGDIPPRRLTAFRAVFEDLARKKIDSEYLDLRFAGQVIVKPRPEAPGDHSELGPSGSGKPRTVKRGRRSQNGLNT